MRFEDDVTDDAVAAEEFVDEDDYFNFMNGFRAQVRDHAIEAPEANRSSWACRGAVFLKSSTTVLTNGVPLRVLTSNTVHLNCCIDF